MKPTNESPKDEPEEEAARPPLPHETDQSAQSQAEEEPRDIGRQAHEDIERGLVDTDRRGNLDGDGQPAQ
ncbi:MULTISPECIES: hypothetical protein [unclassified Caballeronia]|uniref:hypothetical protein n=1 Tax=unclassified Caballeronia TaxID=2646786 RepID=UPI0028556720|nr:MULTISPECIES: hypothetical protein [unclassified Caballeronia]MDR5738280.1 hypothetical protein [Caballeronia sp. LZ016]MDR5811864.1 hypothetical protein [Caballeronia sp. LZ019]